jgi:hypothetical protein
LVLSVVAFSGWLGAFLAGWSFGGAVHLLLAAALALFPWRAAARAEPLADEVEEEGQ